MTVHIRKGRFRIMLPVYTRFVVKRIFRQTEEDKKNPREGRERSRALYAASRDAKKKFGRMTILEVHDEKEGFSFAVKL